MMGFVRPIGGRSISVSGGSGMLPWETWKLITDEARLSKLWGDHIKMPKGKGDTGLLVDVARDFQVTWPVEAEEVVEGSLVKLNIIGNPWHHRPDLVDSRLTLEIGDRLTMKMDGFDLTHLGDSSFLFASSWALSRLTSIICALGGKQDDISGSRSIWAKNTFKLQPDQIRSKILDPEQAIAWLGDEVDIDPRLGGRFNLKWGRTWGLIGLEGNIVKFEPDEISIKLSENNFNAGGDVFFNFNMSQNGDDTTLMLQMTGFDIEPWANIPLMVMSEMIQLQLASLALEITDQFLEPA
ncbi:MAG: hypothetical protein KA140_01430 [Caldisericia bacterium]|nr:hypothetical protein [Caldisericia bacterium]